MQMFRVIRTKKISYALSHNNYVTLLVHVSHWNHHYQVLQQFGWVSKIQTHTYVLIYIIYMITTLLYIQVENNNIICTYNLQSSQIWELSHLFICN